MSIAHVELHPGELGVPGYLTPRVKGVPLAGVLPALRQDPLNFFVRAARDHGDVVALQLGLQPALMINRPDDIRYVLQDNQYNYEKSRYVHVLKPILGAGMFLAEGAEWKRQRQSSARGFQGCHLKKMVGEMGDVANDLVDRWAVQEQRGQAIDIGPEMMRVTLDVVLRCLFSVDDDAIYDQVYKALSVILRNTERRIWSVVSPPTWVPTPENRRFQAALKSLDDFVASVIAKRRAASEPGEDLLQILIDSYDALPAGKRVPSLLRDQVLSLILAGHDTAANALAWTWYLLSKNPSAAVRLRAEVDATLRGRTPEFADIENLRFTKMVFQESMRLYPPLWTFSRDAVEDDRIGKTPVRKGTTVILCAYAVHRRPELWPNPEGFDPDRFDPEKGPGHSRFAYFPFGGGPRTCLGARFAMLEAMIVIAKVMQRFHLDIVPGQNISPEPMITLRPRGKLLMRLSRV